MRTLPPDYGIVQYCSSNLYPPIGCNISPKLERPMHWHICRLLPSPVPGAWSQFEFEDKCNQDKIYLQRPICNSLIAYWQMAIIFGCCNKLCTFQQQASFQGTTLFNSGCHDWMLEWVIENLVNARGAQIRDSSEQGPGYFLCFLGCRNSGTLRF